jgi:hypothetical protein
LLEANEASSRKILRIVVRVSILHREVALISNEKKLN